MAGPGEPLKQSGPRPWLLTPRARSGEVGKGHSWGTAKFWARITRSMELPPPKMGKSAGGAGVGGFHSCTRGIWKSVGKSGDNGRDKQAAIKSRAWGGGWVGNMNLGVVR